MSITTSELGGQLAAEIYNRLLRSARSELNSAHVSRHCDWRFHPPQRPPQAEAALRAYWGELFKDKLKALDTEWSEARLTVVINNSSATEGDDGSQKTDAA